MRKFFTVALAGLCLLGISGPAMADWHGDHHRDNRGWHDNNWRHDNGWHRGWSARERVIYRPVPVVRYWEPAFYDPYYYSYPYNTSFSFIFR
jgi:hypothetical protein